jgi:hypothetical protein
MHMSGTFMEFMSKRMIACDEASYLISLRQDQPIGCRKQMQLRMHLLTCHLCRKYFRHVKQLEQLVDQYREATGTKTPVFQLPDDKSQEIRRAIDEASNVK